MAIPMVLHGIPGAAGEIFHQRNFDVARVNNGKRNVSNRRRQVLQMQQLVIRNESPAANLLRSDGN
jgi:hypothetical protein